jgi:hypothetical protein
MNGKGSSPRDQTPGPDGKTPKRRYADNWDATFGGETDDADHMSDCRCIEIDPVAGTDQRSCPEHAYEAGRRHERHCYLNERAALEAQLAAARAAYAQSTEQLTVVQTRCTALLNELRAYSGSGVCLPGWHCQHCRAFNGSAREVLSHCRACGEGRQ